MHYKIKTHNVLLASIVAVAVILICWILIVYNHDIIANPSESVGDSNWNKVFKFVVVLLVFLGPISFWQFFVFRMSEIELSKDKISAQWTTFPLFNKIERDIYFSEIEYWKITEAKYYTVFKIKTKDHKFYCIPCLCLFSKSAEWDCLINDFESTIITYNLKQPD